MIYAVDLINEQMTLGYRLIINAVEGMGLPVTYVPYREIERYDFGDARVVLFSFMFFDNYLEVGKVFRKMRLPVWAKDRGFPLCIAGGEPVSDNPEPVAEFFDVICVGEGEEWIQEVVEIVLFGDGNKKAILRKIYEEVPGSYVPSMYRIEYEADETVKSLEGKRVLARKGDINRSVESHLRHTRIAQDNQTRKEYLIEQHRGCSRKCAFCSYAYFQHPFRKAKTELVGRAIEDVYRNDARKGNKIVLTQTSGSHIPIELLEKIKWYEKLPRYTSYIYTDIFKDYEKLFLWIDNDVYFRFGIEGFSERERGLWGKPITNHELLMFPSIFSGKGIMTKWFFISHLPTQMIEDVKELLKILEEMSRQTNNFITIEAYVTMLQFKYATPIVFFEKKFNDEVWLFLNQNSVLKWGKLKVVFSKNEDRRKFYLRNFLSLANRKAARVLAGMKGGNVKYDAFDLCREAGIEAGALFGEYDVGKRYCSEHLELYAGHRAGIRKRYLGIRNKVA